MPKSSKPGRRPIITIAFGRQRVGKTALLNAVGQYYREHGCPVQIWNADQQNRSHSLSTFFADSQTVPAGGLEDGKKWIEARFEELAATGCDAILDVGGGATSFARLAAEVPLLEATEESGMLVVGLFVTGPDRADLDYLEQFAAAGSMPKSTVIVMNEGLISSERSAQFAYEGVLQHKAVEAVLMNGGVAATFPALTCMSRVADLGVGFMVAADGGTSRGQQPLGMFDRMRVNRWWAREVPAFFREMPQDWLPIEVRQKHSVTAIEPVSEIATAAE